MNCLLLCTILSATFVFVSADLKLRHKGCTFPFRYKGHTYHYCTKEDAKTPWCAQDAEYKDGRYEQCHPSNCVFPFTYKGKKYDTCTKADSSDYWCSTTSEYSNGGYMPCKGFDGKDMGFS